MTFEELINSELEYIISARTQEETDELAAAYERLVPQRGITFKGMICDRRFAGDWCMGWSITGSYVQIPEFKHLPVYLWKELRDSAAQIDVSNLNELI